MSPDTFDRQIEAARRRLAELEQRAGASAGEKAVMAEALEELSTALEELHVASEELRHQNEELAASRGIIEAERRRYQDLFEFAPDGYLVTDPEGTIREANRAAATLLGVRQEFLVGKPLLVFVAGEAHPAFHERLTRMQGEAETVEDWQASLRPREGSPFPAALTVGVVRDPAGRLTGLRWLVRDITGRKRAEAALLASEEKFAKAFRSSPDAIAITTLADGRFVDVNTSFLRLTGYHREEVIGRTSRDLAIWMNPKIQDRLVRSLEERGAVYTKQFEFRGKSGNVIVGLMSAEVIDIGDERFVLAVVHDITEQKRVEEEREKLVRSLQDALARVKTLGGLLPICSWCKKIRDDQGYWSQVEAYISRHSEAQFSHGICPECAEKWSRKILGGGGKSDEAFGGGIGEEEG
jgi:PAS domain S-box-containing protein